MIPYIHNKTGNRYRLLAHGIDCTNSRDGTPVAIYCQDDNQHTIYVRELAEFEAKFTPAAEPATEKECCEGGPQWGHAWNCPTLP